MVEWEGGGGGSWMEEGVSHACTINGSYQGLGVWSRFVPDLEDIVCFEDMSTEGKLPPETVAAAR